MESCDGIMTDIFPWPTGIMENHVKFTGILRNLTNSCQLFNQVAITFFHSHQCWAVELAVRARAGLVADGGLEVDVDRARHVPARARLRREEGAERVVSPRRRSSCPTASGRPAGCHARGSTAPSTRCRSGCRPGRCGWRSPHAWLRVGSRRRVEVWNSRCVMSDGCLD